MPPIALFAYSCTSLGPSRALSTVLRSCDAKIFYMRSLSVRGAQFLNTCTKRTLNPYIILIILNVFNTTLKVFVADDKFADVITILEQRGWIRSPNADSPNFLLKWRNLSNINFRLLRKDQVQ